MSLIKDTCMTVIDNEVFREVDCGILNHCEVRIVNSNTTTKINPLPSEIEISSNNIGICSIELQSQYRIKINQCVFESSIWVEKDCITLIYTNWDAPVSNHMERFVKCQFSEWDECFTNLGVGQHSNNECVIHINVVSDSTILADDVCIVIIWH